MDLYEALKSGTSEEELLKTFHKELEDANKRIAAETEAEKAVHKEFIKDCREALAEGLVAYIQAVFDEKLNIDNIETFLERFEKEAEKTLSLCKIKPVDSTKMFPIGKIKKLSFSTTEDDQKILDEFIKSLK